MKLSTFASTLVAGFATTLLVPSLASAQPSYGPPPGPPPPPPQQRQARPMAYSQPVPNGGYMHRGGRLTFGASLGLGGMNAESGPIECVNCDYSPLAVGVSAHIGGMISPRFALMLEIQANGKTVAADFYSTQTLVQTAVMIAGQYWATPRLWLKGGIGAANLAFSYDDGYGPVNQDIDNGTSLMGAVGYEILSAPNYAIDLEGRLVVGNYNGINDQLSAAQVGIGFSWY